MEIPEFLYNIKELDVEEGINHCGSENSFIETLTTFADTSAKVADDTEGFWKVYDLKNTTAKIHTMKRMLNIIGAEELCTFAERLEQAGNESDIDMLEAHLPKLIKAYRKLSDAVQPLHDKGSSEESELPEIPPEKMFEIYYKLNRCAKNFDYDKIDELIAELDNYSIPEEEQETCSKLREMADNFDYNHVAELVADKLDCGE